MAYGYLCSFTSATNIIKEVCDVLWDILMPIYLPTPTEETWRKSATKFMQKWQLPNCIGCMDGKHVHIRNPAKSGSLYYNYKSRFSIVLLAVCDADCKFVCVDIGQYGGISDSGVLRSSEFGKALFEDRLHIPADKTLPNSTKKFPHFFAADEAFPLCNHIMRPYGGKNRTLEERIFNARISRARQTIERAFGILVSVWRVLEKQINGKVENVDSIVKATIVLHNFLIHKRNNELKKNGKIITQPNDRLLFREKGTQFGARNAKKQFNQMRDYFKKYLVNVFPLIWLNRLVRAGKK